MGRLSGRGKTGYLESCPGDGSENWAPGKSSRTKGRDLPRRKCKAFPVKLVIAVIQPTKLNAVREALVKIEVTRMTVCDAQGFGRQRGRTELYRGHEYTTQLLRKVVLEIVVNDDFLERTINALIHVARTGSEGNIGDGKIFILPADQAIQLSDGFRGPGAV
jgi:nitrogen regulatory protein P-II 2